MLVHDEFGGFFQVKKFIIRPDPPATVSTPVPGPNQHGPEARVSCCLEIARRISDQPGLRKVDREVSNRALDHPGRWLAAIAFDFESCGTAREAHIGVMGAMVDSRQLGSLLFEQGLQFFVNLSEGGLGQLAPRDRSRPGPGQAQTRNLPRLRLRSPTDGG